jgi:hypothetical protein
MKRIWAFILTTMPFMFTGCPSSGPTLPPRTGGGGFFISTFTSFNFGPLDVAPTVQIQLTWQKDLFGAAGDANPQTVTTNSGGVGIVNNGRTPATWNFKWLFSLTGPCVGQSLNADAHFVDDDVPLVCTVFTRGGDQEVTSTELPDYSFSPDPVITDGSAGSEALISGQGFNSQFGMPLVQYFDLNGNLVAQASATTVAGDGTWMSAPIPDVSQLSPGTYVGLVSNANSSGGYDILGSISVEVTLPTAPSPPPPDPCPDSICPNQS